MKKLYKSRTERMVFGVCGGLARYFEVDVVLVRLLFVLAVLMGGWGLPAYIVAAIVMPDEPKSPPGRHGPAAGKAAAGDEGAAGKEDSGEQPPGTVEEIENRLEETIESIDGGSRTGGPQLFGYILILIGAFFLIRQFIPPYLWAQLWWFRPERLWPLVLVAIGVAILTRRLPR